MGKGPTSDVYRANIATVSPTPSATPKSRSNQLCPRPFTRKTQGGILLLITAAAHAQTPSANDLAKRIDAHYNHLHSLRARYTERYRGMGLDRTETGTLTLEKPGRMRWAYDTPAGKVFVTDGKYAINYTPGDREAQRFPTRQLDDLRSPLRLLLGHTELARELDHLIVARVEGGYNLAGTPRGANQRVRTLILTVGPDMQVLALRMQEVDDSETTFTFTDLHENIPVNERDFTFTPPPGVALVDGPPPT
jgi:outer membrane lipoprotein carrier protein